MSSQLYAPVSGVMTALDEVPDPVFASRMVGDGVSIDPIDDRVVAPCDGTVTLIHPAAHALTVTTADGVEVMVHVGLDTVDLKGEGFTPLVAVGDQVTRGQPLLDFDADTVAERATSLLTQMLIVNLDAVSDLVPAEGVVTAGTDVALRYTLVGGSAADAGADTGDRVESDGIVVLAASGLHARPAAVLAQQARAFTSQVRVLHHGHEANAKSVTAVMTLNIAHGDEVRLAAWGPDADDAVRTLAAAVRSGLGEAVVAVTAAAEPDAAAAPADPDRIQGVAASPGLAVGTVVRVAPPDIEVAPTPAGSPADERASFAAALDRARAQLADLERETAARVGIYQAEIFSAQRQMLDDPDLLDAVADAVRDGQGASYAWKRAYEDHAAALAALPNPLLSARASDIRDVGLRVLGELTGTKPARAQMPDDAIVVARDLTASDTAGLDPQRVRGFVITEGGATSHSSILAQSLGIPAVVGAEARVLDLADGTPVVVDGGEGVVRLNVAPDELERIRERLVADAARKRRNLEAAAEPAVTRDGHRVEVVCNIGSIADAVTGMANGAEGVGLLRSEFVFLDRATAPTEDEQADLYAAAAEAVGAGNRLIIRTLDVGGDKPLPYLPMPHEENPFLGQRGIRVGLEHQQDVLRPQLRAILKAARRSTANIHVMFPMITTLTEFRYAKAILEEERAALDAPRVPVGIMVEVPTVAAMADQFAREADFFSIGTNDLTQYTMAMDRGHPKLAPHVDALNPGVLALIKATVTGAHAHGVWVGVCGALASDPAAATVLLGLGVDELSPVISTVADVKAAVRDLDLAEATALAERALAADDAAAVRALIHPATNQIH